MAGKACFCSKVDSHDKHRLPPRPRRRFVFCRQRQDQKLRRGGEQKSVVVLSIQPYSSVLGQLSQFAGSMYFNHGPEALEEARLATWSAVCS